MTELSTRIRGSYLLVTLVAVFLLAGAGCRVRTNEEIEQYPSPTVGAVARLQPYPRWHVSGTVRIIDDRTMELSGFTFDGGELRADIRLQRGKTKVAVLRDITDERHDGDTLTFAFGDGIKLQDFNLVSIYSPDLGTAVSSARF